MHILDNFKSLLFLFSYFPFHVLDLENQLGPRSRSGKILTEYRSGSLGLTEDVRKKGFCNYLTFLLDRILKSPFIRGTEPQV